MTENIHMFEELAQLTLTLNASTELMDVPEIMMRFSRRTDEEGVCQSSPYSAYSM